MSVSRDMGGKRTTGTLGAVLALLAASLALVSCGSVSYDLAEQALNLYRDGELVMMFGMRR